MKTKFIKYLIIGMVVLVTVRCTKDFHEINTDPNRPSKVPTVNLIGTAEKALVDDIMDEWFSGRQSLLWSQYWAQRNYTSEDRFSIRQNTNSSYWRLIYTDLMDLEEIIKICSDPVTSLEVNANYGDAKAQIAAANVLKAWAFQILTDTYGDVPYANAFQAETNPTPDYTSSKDIYIDLLKKLKSASDVLSNSDVVFNSGDLIFGGDAAKWAKFANSMRLRLAIRLTKVTDPTVVALRDAAFTEAVVAGAFSSNADIAKLTYLGDGASNAPMYDGFYTSRRNDMTVTAQFVDLLKGINDTLNSKVNPFKGIVDPRLAIWAPKAKGVYRGMPYGLTDGDASNMRAYAANIYNFKPTYLQANYAPVFIDYAEVCFIQSEINGWDQAWYVKGVRASLESWGVDANSIDTYVAALPAASKETVLTQKYIALYMNGYEAWAEWRRNGYPKFLVQPGEKTGPNASGKVITFTPIVGDAIPRRLTYPVQEYTINKSNVEAAASAIGSDKLNTKLWWDK